MRKKTTLLACLLCATVAVATAGAAAAAQCNGTPGQWSGCRGTGCSVCAELVASYPLYFVNHPSCISNTTCQGLYYTCNEACPAPSYADQCNGTAGQWSGCRGTGCSVCAELVADYPSYFDNHPLCIPNTTCGGLYYTCNANCPAPTEADRCGDDTCSSCNRPASGVDNDGDGIPDRLEYDLAYKYFPNIKLQHWDTDLNQTYVYRGKAIPYLVRRYGPALICDQDRECLEIRYGLAYFNDTGDPTWGGSHPGDSEFYAVLVQRQSSWSVAQYTADDWQMIRDFTAAHWRSGADSSKYGEFSGCPPWCHQWDNNGQACLDNVQCIWFPGLCIGGGDANNYPCSWYYTEGECFFAGGSCQWIDSSCGSSSSHNCYSSSPRTSRWTAYAAEGKHALYHTDSECDGGGVCVPLFGCSDECPNNTYNMRDYISGRLQNVGNSNNHGAFDTLIQDPDDCTLYDVWGGADFGEATPYNSHFTYSLYWDLPEP